MSFEFRLPDIGEGVVEGEIVAWKVAVGDRLELDQPMVEVMTDKATVEIPAPRAGTVTQINFQAGDICPVGEVLVVIEESGEDETAAPPAGESNGAGNDNAPAHGGSQGRTPVAVATQPSAPVPAPTPARAPVAAGPAPTPLPRAEPQLGPASRTPGGRILATPATRRLARQLGVELASVPASGRRGRVTSDDVRRFAQGGQLAPAASAAPAVASGRATVARPAQPVVIPNAGPEERIPLRGMRKRIADNMARSVFTAAHFTYVEEIDMTELVAVRQRAKVRAEDRGLKLTYLPFLIKAVVSGLKKWPQLNAALDESTQEIVRKKYYHIGVAAQGPHGLAVTVVRDADRRSIFDLAAEIARLAAAVRDGTATRDDLSGSTFTITSLGKLGGVLATPIINFPEVGILGVHKMEQRPAVRDGEIVIRWLMNLSISLDHRLVDGWDGAMFLQDIKALLEDPTTMFMEMI